MVSELERETDVTEWPPECWSLLGRRSDQRDVLCGRPLGHDGQHEASARNPWVGEAS